MIPFLTAKDAKDAEVTEEKTTKTKRFFRETFICNLLKINDLM